MQLSARNVMLKILWTLINTIDESTPKTAKQNKFQGSKCDLWSRQSILFKPTNKTKVPTTASYQNTENFAKKRTHLMTVKLMRKV
jgi:hypothetical protein